MSATPFQAYCPPPHHIGRSRIWKPVSDVMKGVSFPRSLVVPCLRAEIRPPPKVGLSILSEVQNLLAHHSRRRGISDLTVLQDLATAAGHARAISGDWEMIRLRAKTAVVQSMYVWVLAYTVDAMLQDEDNPQWEFSVEVIPSSGPAMPNPFRFSALTGLFDDGIIENLAEEIFIETQKAVLERNPLPSVEAYFTAIDLEEYLSTMEHLMSIPQYVAKVEELGHGLLQEPSVSSFLEVAKKSKCRKIRACHSDDSLTKALIEEILENGPTGVLRYWNKVDVLYDLGEALGLTITSPDDKLV